MKNTFLSSCLAVFSLLLLSLPAYANAVHMIQLEDDTINPVTAEYILEAIDQAEETSAEALIIKLDTPGGLLNSTRKIVKGMMASRIPVVVYIAPAGSRAGSAGVFITYASHAAAMAPSTNIGAAHPVQMGGDKKRDRNMWDQLKDRISEEKKDEGEGTDRKEVLQNAEINEDPDPQPDGEDGVKSDQDLMSSKILNDTVAFIRSLAEQRGRNAEWAVKSVVRSESIIADQALEKNVVEIIAVDDSDLLRQLDGRSVKVLDGDIELQTADAELVFIPMSSTQKLFNVLANPNVAYILMILGFYGLLYEITNPGIGVPGIAGTIFLILAFFSMQTLPTNYAGLALVVLGLILFAAEAMVPGLGLLTLGGLVSLILGSLLLFDTSFPMMRVSLAVILPFALATAGITILLIKAALSAQKGVSSTGAEGLVGETGTAKTDISPGKEGKVFVHGETWTAYSDDTISSSEPIDVVEMKGLKLKVKKHTE
ncbi:MAG: NfeD family protein [Candidatus Omnitrophota bacterium]